MFCFCHHPPQLKYPHAYFEGHHPCHRAGARRASAGFQLCARRRRRKAHAPRPLLPADDAAAGDATHRDHVRRHRVLLEDVAQDLLRQHGSLYALRHSRRVGDRTDSHHRLRPQDADRAHHVQGPAQGGDRAALRPSRPDRTSSRRRRIDDPHRGSNGAPPASDGVRSRQNRLAAHQRNDGPGRLDGLRPGSRAAVPRLLCEGCQRVHPLRVRLPGGQT